MNVRRLRLLIHKYGEPGVFLAALYLGGHHLWTKRRPALAAGILLSASLAWFCLRPEPARPARSGGNAAVTRKVPDGQPAQQAALLRFTHLARQLRTEQVGEKPEARMAEALEILTQAALAQCKANPRITDEQILKRLDAYTQAVMLPGEEVDADEPTWFDIHAACRGSICAIAVTYGPVAHLGVFDLNTGEALRVPAAMQWLYPWHPQLRFMADGILLLLSESVEAMGSREGLRTDTFSVQQGRCRPVDTLLRQWELEMDLPDVQGNRLIIHSVDDPVSFFTCAVDTSFAVKEVFNLHAGRLILIGREKQNPLLRTVDAWIARARQAKHPNTSQRLIQQRFPEREIMGNFAVKRLASNRLQFTLGFESVTLRFLIKTPARGYEVVSAGVQ